ncbi:MAG: hypothetical protein KKD21_15465, partial [Proteobacteria bacterium]|nr:hypothetical protein [Pseudomonadota bacterium]
DVVVMKIHQYYFKKTGIKRPQIFWIWELYIPKMNGSGYFPTLIIAKHPYISIYYYRGSIIADTNIMFAQNKYWVLQ